MDEKIIRSIGTKRPCREKCTPPGKKPKLNENQQVVLEWLEAYADKDSGVWPMQTIFYMWDCIRSDRLGGEELSALRKLTRIEQFEVLAAFAEWGKKEVAE